MKTIIALLVLAATTLLALDNKQLTVQWDAVPNATEYRLYYSTAAHRVGWTNITTGTSITLSNLTDRPWFCGVTVISNGVEVAVAPSRGSVTVERGSITNTVTGTSTTVSAWTNRGVRTLYSVTPTTNTLSFR